MSKKPVKKAPKKNGYKMPDPIPNGEILQDMSKKKWIIGPSIGVGGFGEIYSASEYKDKKPTTYPYVIKIEPHGNGPLFVEMHFYMRNAKADDIEAWRSKKKLPTLGMPSYIGSGSHECNGTKYRFVVMERFGQDLWHLFLEAKRCFPTPTAFRIAVQMLDVLEYIHSKGYVHADIKGANALLGISKSTQNQVYLVDFGLAAHYSTKEFKTDPKKAHNGTIEYTSRDAHSGVPTRRGDLEILAYNLIHWLGCTLPWENCLADPVAVQNAKIKFMDNVETSLRSCFKNKDLPDALKKFVTYVSKMKHDTEPDYAKCHSFLVSGVESAGGSMSGTLEFGLKSKSPKRKSDQTALLSLETPEKKRKIVKKRTKKTDLKEQDEEMVVNKKGRSKKTAENNENKKKNYQIDESDSESEETSSEKPESVASNGFTAEMLRIKERMEANKKAKTKPKPKKASTSSSSSKKSSDLSDEKKSSVDLSDSDGIIDETPPEPQRRRARKAQGDFETPPSKTAGRARREPVFYGERS